MNADFILRQPLYVAAVLLLSMSSCGSTKPKQTSSLQWGFIRSFLSDGFMKLEPDSTINICASGETPAKSIAAVSKAIKEWAMTIDRDRALTVNETCGGTGSGNIGSSGPFNDEPNGPGDLALVSQPTLALDNSYGNGGTSSNSSNRQNLRPSRPNIFDQFQSSGSTSKTAQVNLSFSDSQGMCSKGAAAYTYPVGNNQYRIVFCSMRYSTSYDIVVHEVGHIWGNCDRYRDMGAVSMNPTFGSNCDGPKSRSPGSSAMQAGGPGHPHKVTEDDKAGMQEVSQLNTLASNKIWDQYLASNSGNTNDSDLASNQNNNPGAGRRPSTNPSASTINSNYGKKPISSSTAPQKNNTNASTINSNYGKIRSTAQQKPIFSLSLD